MKDSENFWQEVHEILDNHRDPLDSNDVQDHLLEHPELLDEYASLSAGLGQLTAVSPAQRVRRPRRHVAALCAVIILAVGTALACSWYLSREITAAPDSAPLILPDLAMDGGVLEFASRSYTRRPGGEVAHQFEAGSVSVRETEIRTQTRLRVQTPHGHPIHTEFAHLRSYPRTVNLSETP